MPLSKERIKTLKDFCRKNGLKCRNFELLNRAFCHTSYIYENGQNRLESYERLEFLGDAVLKLAASDLLFTEFPEKMEGALTERRAAIVSDKIIATFSKKLGLGCLILTGKCENDCKKESILACSFEALLGAIYIENGYQKTREFLVKHLKDDILSVDCFNPKAKLQEYTQKYNHNLPKYVILEEKGPAHDKTFVIGVYYQEQFIQKGEAKSRKMAEFKAAKKALAKLKEMHGESL